jgi:tryptophanyl-tRNA synthetase
MRILSGVQPSGKLHIGNYFGAIKQHIALQDGNESTYFIADLHALTTVRDAARLRDLTRDVALDYLALGLDPARATFFRQSDVPEVCELSWVLSTVTPMSLLEKAHSFKDKTAKGIPADHGLFAYPVLMAADILIQDADRVPVGKDQKQHIEIARDIAVKLNETYCKTYDPKTGLGGALRLPEPMIVEETAVVPGTDLDPETKKPRKMSKSYNNTIELFGDPKAVKKAVMGIVTDSAGVADPKDPEHNTIYQLLRLFSTKEEIAQTADEFRKGGVGYGDFKKRLLEKVTATFAAARARREELVRTAAVEDVLAEGARKATVKAREVLGRVREAVGIGPLSK